MSLNDPLEALVRQMKISLTTKNNQQQRQITMAEMATANPPKQYGEPPTQYPSTSRILPVPSFMPMPTIEEAIPPYGQPPTTTSFNKIQKNGCHILRASPKRQSFQFQQSQVSIKMEPPGKENLTRNGHLIRRKSIEVKNVKEKNQNQAKNILDTKSNNGDGMKNNGGASSTTIIQERKGSESSHGNNGSLKLKYPFGRNKRTQKRPLIRYEGCKSRLRIKNPDDMETERKFVQLSKQSAHGYSEENSNKALSRFIARGILRIDSTQFRESSPNKDKWGQEEYICEKSVTVPAIPNAHKIPFKGHGMTKEEAETSCNLKIIVELFDFEVIKEAAMELYCRGRKKLLDPAKKFDKKIHAWLKTGTQKFLQEMDAISARPDVFY